MIFLTFIQFYPKFRQTQNTDTRLIFPNRSAANLVTISNINMSLHYTDDTNTYFGIASVRSEDQNRISRWCDCNFSLT